MPDRPLPLSGIRVLDVATVLAAPVTATMLGDFGADVVKIEEPGHGDFTRNGPGAASGGARSLQWIQEARNKKSVTVDLRTPRGQQLLRDLVPHFDVVVTNYRPPTLEKWGLAPDRLRELNPRAVIVCLTGYGLSGPYRDRGAFDRVASAFAGLTYVSGEQGRPPVRSGYAVIDYMAAYLAAFATVTALFHRDLHGGDGQIIDLALYEAGFRAGENALLAYGALGQVRERSGNQNPDIVPASDFDTADGRRVSLHAGTDTLFRRLCQVIGRPHLVDDPRFAGREERVSHQDELYPLIAEWVASQDADTVVRMLNDANIPAAPIMSIADIAADPHYRERGTFVEVDDPEHGPVPMVAALPRMSETPGRIRSLGPRLGEHTDEILHDLLGLGPAEIRALHEGGVI
ncbi:MAG TPA: CoA transferase [Pseudonocardiaceae bacterium]|jgi:crotonobetainyl-CoA:carnitine CoA-transferase CaiB-like acyl-CoA transferase|nr:CoA transferase [Pseudonocardiaceae bacterium]